MSYANLQGQRVISGSVTIPMQGVWTADLVLASDADLSGSLTLTLGNLALVGVKHRTLSDGGSRAIRLIGGAGGWGKTLPSKFYGASAGVQLSTVLNDAAREVGETLSLESDANIGPTFTRKEGPAGDVLALLAPFWFMRPDGTTRVGARTSKAIASQFEVTSVSGAAGHVVVGTEDLASWMPGNTFTSRTITQRRTISGVVHTINDGVIRTESFLVGLASPVTEDRLRDSLLAFVRSATPERAYHGHYEYVVVSQSGQAISGRPSDPSLGLPELVDVPLRPSILGGVVQLSPGSTVVVGFINGSPTRPEVLFASETTAVAIGGALLTSPRVLREGDTLTVGAASGAVALSVPNPVPGVKLQ